MHTKINHSFVLVSLHDKVLVTGSCTLDPVEEHIKVARAICVHAELNPESAIIVESSENKPAKPHSL